MSTSLLTRRYWKWILPSQVKTRIWNRPDSSPISRMAVCLAFSPGSICPLGMVQRPLESWIKRISISDLSRVVRNTMPPAVGSRTTSWMAGFLKTRAVNRETAFVRSCSLFNGKASGTLRDFWFELGGTSLLLTDSVVFVETDACLIVDVDDATLGGFCSGFGCFCSCFFRVSCFLIRFRFFFVILLLSELFSFVNLAIGGAKYAINKF